MNRNETIEFLKNMCKERGVTVKFVKLKGCYGKCSSNGKTIFIKKTLSRKDMINVALHELVHAHCIENGIWKQFHQSTYYSPLKTFMIENWVERKARKEWDKLGMRRMFGQYRFSYLKQYKKKLIEWIAKSY